MKRIIGAFVLLLSCLSANGQTIRLYNTTRATGSLQELHLVTGAVVAGNVGGITNGRGMAFSPLGGLYIANGSNVSSLASTISVANSVLSYAGETPHDLCFDATGNMYVITDLNIHVYNTLLVQTLVFAHGLATTTGDGNPNKGWGIAIRPDNGDIYAVGSQGLKRFSAATGIQIGSTIAGSAFGFAGIAFTNSNFTGAYLYVGNVISGVDQIRVFDTNLNLLRSYFAPHNGNPIDLEVNSATGDIYLFNTVVSNPANRFSSIETMFGTFSGAANPTCGSALGSFEPTPLAENNMVLEVETIHGQQHLQWALEGQLPVDHFVIEGAPNDFIYSELGSVNGSTSEFWEENPQDGPAIYKVSAFGSNGERICSAIAYLNQQNNSLSIHQNIFAQELIVRSSASKTAKISIHILGMNSAVVCHQEILSGEANFHYSNVAEGVYFIQAQSWDKNNAVLATVSRKIRIAR